MIRVSLAPAHRHVIAFRPEVKRKDQTPLFDSGSARPTKIAVR